MSLELAVIADDITGACDVAAGISALGLAVEVRLGVPDAADRPEDADCVVVALKSRTAPVDEATADSVASARVLRGWGAERLYQKYCSTFDSTDEGNIGPVADALLTLLPDGAISAGTPASPELDRTVYRGHLFVGDRLLSESSLAQHPLTPMRDPDLVRVLGRQSPHPVAAVALETAHAGASAVAERLAELRAEGVRHVLFDAVEERDLEAISAALERAGETLMGGGSGLAVAIARRFPRPGRVESSASPEGRGLILSGSGSERTREQVAAHRGPRFDLEVESLVADADAVIADAGAFIDAVDGIPMVSATADPEAVRKAQDRWGRGRAATLIEEALARIAVDAVERRRVRRILVAGGETSGAVAAAVGALSLRVRRAVAPGVAWTIATDPAGRTLDLCFKSGNFGGEDLFAEAWEELA